MTTGFFVFLIILIWITIASFIYLKYKKAVKNLALVREELENSKKVLEIQVKARTRQVKEQAKALREENEQKTKDLKKRLEELERFQRLMVGRELKMMELKEKIKKMEAQFKEASLALEKYAKKSKERKNKKS